LLKNAYRIRPNKRQSFGLKPNGQSLKTGG
jgi:hypothetical protein